MIDFRKSFVSLDTETTGLDPLTGHRIVEIGAVRFTNGKMEEAKYHYYLNPEGKKVDAGAYRVHGIADEFLLDKPFFKDVAQELIDFVANDPVVIHNAEFDIKHLAWEFHRAGMDMTFIEDAPIIDTLDYSRKNRKGRHNLDAIADSYGIDRSDRTLHGALVDARILGEVAQCMIGTPNQISIFGAKDVFDVRSGSDYFNIVGSSNVHESKRQYVPKTLPPVDEASQVAHKSLMDRIKDETGEDAVWDRNEQSVTSQVTVPRM